MSGSSNRSEESLKNSAKYIQESQCLISELRTKCAILATSEMEQKTAQALNESRQYEKELSDMMDTLNCVRKLVGTETVVGTSCEDLPELESSLKHFEVALKALKEKPAQTMLNGFAPLGILEHKNACEAIKECDQLVTDLKNQDIVAATEEIASQVSSLNNLFNEISENLEKLENLNQLEDALRIYGESLAITNLMTASPN